MSYCLRRGFIEAQGFNPATRVWTFQCLINAVAVPVCPRVPEGRLKLGLADG
jgi:hypothetical protein